MASLNASITSTGLISSGDASGVLALQTNGANALIVNANANVTVSNSLFVSGNSVQPLVSGTSQNTTSGTSIDFTSIPSWVRRITVLYNGVSTSGSSALIVQIGAGSIIATGYTGTGTGYSSGSGTVSTITGSSVTYAGGGGGATYNGGTPRRGNYAGVGYMYDKENDVFYAQQPFSSWVLNTNTWLWESPVPYPNDGESYFWNEEDRNWNLIEK